MAIEAFINQYFLNPLYAGDAVYNMYNTIVYALLLVAGVFGVYKILKKFEVKIDFNFFVSLTPFILLASVLRVLRDAGIYKSPVFVSPLIYLLIFGVAFTALLIGILIERTYRYNYDLPVFLIGLVLLIYFGRHLTIPQIAPVLQILAITLTIIGMFLAVKKMYPGILSGINIFVLSAAMFDAASTFIGVSYYGYLEKHVLPDFLFGIFGPWVMFPLKFGVVLFALYVIDTTETDNNFKNFLKFAILTVTLGPGARNTLRMMLGV
ncbi:MAG: DUF63 family protein [Candidatus Undinarchaeales archaeon]